MHNKQPASSENVIEKFKAAFIHPLFAKSHIDVTLLSV